MKKIYTSILVSGMMFSTVVFGQTDKQMSTETLNSQQKQNILAEVKNAPVTMDHQSKLPTVCDSLTAATAAGNSFSGNMFDIAVASAVTLETFSVSVDAGTWNIAIFYKAGTFVGSETSATGWIFLDSAMVTSTTTGAGAFYKVPVSLNLSLAAGTYAFYVTATDAGATFNYTNGTTLGATLSSDAYLSIKEGNGGSYPFGVTFSPRVFNGRAHYCVTTSGIEENNSLPTVELFPNPASQSVSVDLSAFNGNNVSISIMNTLGQRMESFSLMANGVKTLNLDGYSKGLYFVQVEMNGKTSTSKLAIK
jgi:nitrogen regulatory protein PII